MFGIMKSAKKNQEYDNSAFVSQNENNNSGFAEDLKLLKNIIETGIDDKKISNPQILALLKLINENRDNGNTLLLKSAVASSMSSSEIQASIARAYAEVTQSESEIGIMAAAIEEMTASISQISALAQQTDDALTSATRTASIAAEQVENAANSSQRVTESLGVVHSDLSNLTAAANDIKEMAQEIDNIASQTNLLALNATIEAARAGEAGKGFAVVAQEVKQLSSQTAKSTENIRARIARLETAINAILGAVNTSRDAAQSSQEAAIKASRSVADSAAQVSDGANGVANVAQVLNEQSGAVRELSEGVHKAASASKEARVLIDEAVDVVSNSEAYVNNQLTELEGMGIKNYVLYRAKSDHILWKKRLASLISGKSELSENELTDHQSCRLGKWWGLAKSEFMGKSQSFVLIEEPHKRVHEFGKEAARRFNSGDKKGALESYFKMEDASKEVVKYLDRMIEEVN